MNQELREARNAYLREPDNSAVLERYVHLLIRYVQLEEVMRLYVRHRLRLARREYGYLSNRVITALERIFERDGAGQLLPSLTLKQAFLLLDGKRGQLYSADLISAVLPGPSRRELPKPIDIASLTHGLEESVNKQVQEAHVDTGEIWECASCGDVLFGWEDTGNFDSLIACNEWAILGPEASEKTIEEIGRGDEGEAMCVDCLSQAGVDIEEAGE